MNELKLFKISNGGLKGDALPSRIKVLSWGKNQSTDGDFTVGTKTVTGVLAQAKQGYERIAIDFNHCSVPGTQAYRDCIKEGTPPLIFGYGRPSVTPGDGLFLEDVIWTPCGQKNARNYEDLSPALADDAGEVTMVHSLALTPNGKVTDLHFFNAEIPKKTMNAQIDMSRIFNVENWIAQRREFHLLSAGGKTGPLDADQSEAIEIVRKMIREGKRPRKPDGSIYSDSEMLSMPLDSLKKLYDETPNTAPPNTTGEDTTGLRDKKLKTMSAGGRVVKSMAEIFDEETEARYGKGHELGY